MYGLFPTPSNKLPYWNVLLYLSVFASKLLMVKRISRFMSVYNADFERREYNHSKKKGLSCCPMFFLLLPLLPTHHLTHPCVLLCSVIHYDLHIHFSDSHLFTFERVMIWCNREHMPLRSIRPNHIQGTFVEFSMA